MPRLELTIKTDYLPDWDVWAALRELAQNGRDAEVEFGAPLKMDWHNQTLRIENTGTTLPHEALLLGHTTKLGRGDLIGKFGEGLKLGVLVLVRNGLAVKIRSGSEVWEPRIERSEKFNADVLVFNITGGRKDENRVRIEVSGCTKEVWEQVKERFLWLRRMPADTTVKTASGTLLLDPDLKGHIYVKGIYVMSNPDLNYGYDLYEADLDRDRRLIGGWELRSQLQKIWTVAVVSRPDLLDPFFRMLEVGQEDVAGVSTYTLYSMPAQVKEQVAQTFTERFGENAIAVQTLDQSKEIEHLGRQGVVVSSSLAAIMSESLGSIEKIKADLKSEVVHRYSWHELTDLEKGHLESSLALVQKAVDIQLGAISIVDFRSEDLQGQYKEGQITLARKILGSRQQTLYTLVHEAAHHAGGHADRSYLEQLQDIWSTIVESLR